MGGGGNTRGEPVKKLSLSPTKRTTPFGKKNSRNKPNERKLVLPHKGNIENSHFWWFP